MDYKIATVVILTYNNLKYLDNAIKSVLQQDYPYIEVLVQDDCSKDFNQEEVEKKFVGKKENIINISIGHNSKNLGTVRNFNKAIEKAKGDIIIPLACDDVFYDKTVISDIVQFFRDKQCVVCSGLRKGTESGNVEPKQELIKEFVQMDKLTQLCRLYYSNFISGATLYYDKNFLLKLGGFDERFCLLEDYPMILKIFQEGFSCEFLDRITIFYNECGISQNHKNKKKIHPKLNEDFKKVYELCIFPNEELILSARMKRYLKNRYYRKYETLGFIKQVYYSIKYLDIVVFKIYMRLMSSIRKEKINEFGALMK